MAVVLRPYQKAGIDKLRAAFGRGAKAPLFVLATGGGKTICFSYITHSAAERGKRVLIVAHRKELIKQASQKLLEAGVDHGVIAPWAPFNPGARVQVGSIQTLVNRLDKIGSFDLIVVDEGHHAVAGNYKRLIASQPRAKLLLVTATPERLDGKGLGASVGGLCDDMILGPSAAELIADGYLSPVTVYAPEGGGPDMSDVGVEMGEYKRGGSRIKMSGSKITGDAVAHYLKYGKGQPFVAFCVDVDHAHTIADTFKAAGIKARAADGKMNADDRQAALDGLANGSVEVLCVCDLVSEGLDIPAIVGIITLRPTKSLTNFLQWVGRAGRPVYAPGMDLSTAAGRHAAIAAGPKPRCLVLDHAGCSDDHGHPVAAREWSLLGRKKGEKAPPTRQCPECYAIHTPAPICPECGWVYEVNSQPRSIQLVDGALAEFTLTPSWARGMNIGSARGQDWQELLGMADTREKLQQIARVRGYKSGWIRHQIEARQAAA